MTFGLANMTFGVTGFVLLNLVSFALTLWAAVVTAGQRQLGVLERVLLVAIAVFAPFVGPVVVLVVAPRLAPPRT